MDAFPKLKDIWRKLTNAFRPCKKGKQQEADRNHSKQVGPNSMQSDHAEGAAIVGAHDEASKQGTAFSLSCCVCCKGPLCPCLLPHSLSWWGSA